VRNVYVCAGGGGLFLINLKYYELEWFGCYECVSVCESRVGEGRSLNRFRAVVAGNKILDSCVLGGGERRTSSVCLIFPILVNLHSNRFGENRTSCFWDILNSRKKNKFHSYLGRWKLDSRSHPLSIVLLTQVVFSCIYFFSTLFIIIIALCWSYICNYFIWWKLRGRGRL